MGSSPMTPEIRARAIKLYEIGNSWPDVAKIMHRNPQALARSLGKYVSRSLSDAALLAWKKKYGPGPRKLDTDEERKLYKKLRESAGMPAGMAIREVSRMREL